MLTVQLLIKNNQETIEQTLQSLIGLDAKVVAGNLGCTDDTVNICRKYRVEVVDIPWESDYSKARNRLITKDWNLYIEPWEVFADGYEHIRKPKKPGAFSIQVFSNNIITKELRYWHGDDLKFHNPVYESIPGPTQQLDGVVIFAGQAPDNRQERLKIAQKWLNREPTKAEPHYYVAMGLLSMGMYRPFIGVAEQYLLRDTSSQSSIMTRYYLAHVMLHCLNDSKSAGKHILSCISAQPLMAEYWCLLGDLYYHQKKYDKAIALYQNAILLGSRRSNDDGWPIEIEKYRDYPKRMIENAKQIKGNTRVIGSK